MNDTLYERVKNFTRSNFWEPKGGITPETRLAEDLRIAGLDGKEFMETYAQEFGVDLTGFDWVEYFGAEGLGCLLFLPFARLWDVCGLGDRSRRLRNAAHFEIRIQDLADWAAVGVWTPPHTKTPSRNQESAGNEVASASDLPCGK